MNRSRLTVRQELRLLTVSRAACARWLELSPKVVENLISEGGLRLVQVGRTRRIPLSDVERVMKAIVFHIQNRPDRALRARVRPFILRAAALQHAQTAGPVTFEPPSPGPASTVEVR